MVKNVNKIKLNIKKIYLLFNYLMFEENIKFFFSENESKEEPQKEEPQKEEPQKEELQKEELQKEEPQNPNLTKILSKKNKQDEDAVNIINYNINYTIKELMLICSYYGISQNIKINKCNKEEIILALVTFENDTKNQEIVFKRKNMWFYISELKNDKFMKKYILL
jgi:hypothetical protein